MDIKEFANSFMRAEKDMMAFPALSSEMLRAMVPPEMLGRSDARRLEALAAKAATAVLDPPKLPEQKAIAPVEADSELDQHAELAKRLGVVAAPTGARRLQTVLAEEGFSEYDFQAVRAYMDGLASQKANLGWYWFPARLADGAREGFGMESLIAPWGGRPNNGNILSVQYPQMIPLPVLMTMDRLAQRLGEEVRMFIGSLFDWSTVPERKLDPFLGVMASDDHEERMFVIERWDEPGFRGVKAE